MSPIDAIDARLDLALEDYWNASRHVSDVSLELIQAIAREYVPTAVVVMLNDSDQEGSTFVFSGFEDAEDNEVEYDEDVVDDLIWGPISNLRNDDVLDYRIELPLVTCDDCDATSESGWGDTPLCLKCEKPENICTKHNRTFVGHCPLG